MFGSLQIWSKYTLHGGSSHWIIGYTHSRICVGIEIKGSSNIINYFTIDNLTFTTTETKRRVWKTFPERTVRLCLWGIPNMVYKGFLWQILHLHSSTSSHEKCEINLWVRVFSSKSSWRLLRHHLLQGCDLRHHISFPGHLTEKYFRQVAEYKKIANWILTNANWSNHLFQLFRLGRWDLPRGKFGFQGLDVSQFLSGRNAVKDFAQKHEFASKDKTKSRLQPRAIWFQKRFITLKIIR